MPGIGFSASRIALSSSFCERVAVARVGELQVDPRVVAPLLGADGRHRQRRSPGIRFSAASTWRTLPSVYSRLEPTGVLRRSEMKPSSASG